MSALFRRLAARLLDLSMRAEMLAPHRAKLVAQAGGVTLEVGFGSGANLPFLPPAVTELIAVEPDAEILRLAAPRIDRCPVPVRIVRASAEALPLADRSVDTAVLTLTLCTVPDPVRSLREIARVLKPDGRLLFLEHGQAPDPGVARWQRRLNPISRLLACGCTLDRRPDHAFAAAGFAIRSLKTGYLPGAPRFSGHAWRGMAAPRHMAMTEGR